MPGQTFSLWFAQKARAEAGITTTLGSTISGLGVILGRDAFGARPTFLALIAMKVADAAVKSIENNNNFDQRYLVDGVVPASAKRGYSVNYAVVGEQVPVFGSALPAGVIKDDGPMAEHHGPTYRKLTESPPLRAACRYHRGCWPGAGGSW